MGCSVFCQIEVQFSVVEGDPATFHIACLSHERGETTQSCYLVRRFLDEVINRTSLVRLVVRLHLQLFLLCFIVQPFGLSLRFLFFLELLNLYQLVLRDFLFVFPLVAF